MILFVGIILFAEMTIMLIKNIRTYKCNKTKENI